MAVDGAARGLAVLALVLIGAIPAAGQAHRQAGQPETGRDWLARCGMLPQTSDAAAEPQPHRACSGWIEGLIDLNEIYRGLGALEQTPEGFCTPPTATVAEAATAVVRYIEDHPDAQRFSARILAYMALRRAFPCRGTEETAAARLQRRTP